MVPLISNGESCWALPPHTTAGGGSDEVCDIFTAVSVYVRLKGGGPALVSSVKVRTSIIFYIESFCCSAERHKRTISVFIARLPLVHFSCPCWCEERQQSNAISNATCWGNGGWKQAASSFCHLGHAIITTTSPMSVGTSVKSLSCSKAHGLNM